MQFIINYPKSISEYSMNSIYAGKHWKRRQEDSDYWHWLVRAELNKQKIPKQLFEKSVKITFFWNDSFDIDNHAYMGKMIVDALKGYLIKDDTKKYFGGVAHYFHKEKYILVEVKELWQV